MIAYLDNNIIIDIEQGNLSEEVLRANIDSNIETFYYSAAHLQEAHEISGTLAEKRIRLKRRFETISNITDNNYLFHELPTNKVHKLKESPKVVYQTITQVTYGQNAMKAMINNVTEDQKAIVRQQLDINPLELNNYTAEQVLEQVGKKILVFGGHSIKDIIEIAVGMHPDGKIFGLHNRIGGVFELLDMIGYWKDKYNEKSNYARLWDSNHTYFSSFCNYFISDDKRTRNKARVAFTLYDIDTKVLSSQGTD